MPEFSVENGDCAPFHLAYIRLVESQDLSAFLPAQQVRFSNMISNIPEDRGNEAYAPGKWTIKQVLQHVIDTERIFAYRLLALCRGEQQPIPGFEQDDYMAAVDVSGRSLDDQCREFDSVRSATITLMESLRPQDLQHRGTISESPVLAAALPYVLAGHVEHHIGVLISKYRLSG